MFVWREKERKTRRKEKEKKRVYKGKKEKGRKEKQRKEKERKENQIFHLPPLLLTRSKFLPPPFSFFFASFLQD